MNNVILRKDLDHPKLGFITAGTRMNVTNEFAAELYASGHIANPFPELVKDEEE